MFTYSFFCYCTSTEDASYHSQFGKRAWIPIFRLQAKILSSFQTKCFKCSYLKKYTLLNPFFGKYLEPRKKLTRFAWSKPLQKCWTVVIFGHLSWFLWTKTIISIFYFKDYYSRNKVEKIICWQITLGATSLTINPSPSKKKKNHQN